MCRRLLCQALRGRVPRRSGPAMRKKMNDNAADLCSKLQLEAASTDRFLHSIFESLGQAAFSLVLPSH